MAVTEDYILSIASGVAWTATKNTASPTGFAAPAVAWTDLGAISTEGITNNMAQSRTEFKRWGNINTFRTVVTDQKQEFQVKFLESKPAVLGLFHRVATPTPDATTKIFTVQDDTTGKIDRRAFLFDLVNGTNTIRFYCPLGEVTNVESPVYKLDGLVEYGVTITAYPDVNGVSVLRSYKLDASE